MDTPGPLTRTVEDTALVMQVIAGHDPRDPTTSRRSVPDHRAALAAGVRGVRIGVARELVASPDVDAEVRDGLAAALGVLKGRGAMVEEVSLPLLPLAGAVFMTLADSDGAGLHQPWLRSRPQDYDRGTRRRLLTASLIPAARYHQAQRARALIRRQLLEALERWDLLAWPTAPQPAPPISRGAAPITAASQVAGAVLRAPLLRGAGVARVAAGCGRALGVPRAGLPLSLQLIGRPFGEAPLLAAAHAYEQATGWSRRPPV